MVRKVAKQQNSVLTLEFADKQRKDRIMLKHTLICDIGLILLADIYERYRANLDAKCVLFTELYREQ